MADQLDLEKTRAYLAHTRFNQSGSECVSTKTLSRAVEGKLSKREIHRVVNHCSLCSLCAADWSAAKTLLDALAPEPKVQDRRQAAWATGSCPSAKSNGSELLLRIVSKLRSIRQRSLMPLVAACAGLSAAWVIRQPSQVQDVEQPRIMRGERTPISKLGFDARKYRFDWKPVLHSPETCEVLVYDRALDQVARWQAQSDGLTLSAPQQAQLRRLPSFFWQVRCRPSDGAWYYSKNHLQRRR